MYCAVIQRTATSLFVEHLHLEQHHVGTIGLSTFGILNSREFQLVGFAHGLQLIAATVIGHCLQYACLERHILESKEIAVALLTLTE